MPLINPIVIKMVTGRPADLSGEPWLGLSSVLVDFVLSNLTFSFPPFFIFCRVVHRDADRCFQKSLI